MADAATVRRWAIEEGKGSERGKLPAAVTAEWDSLHPGDPYEAAPPRGDLSDAIDAADMESWFPDADPAVLFRVNGQACIIGAVWRWDADAGRYAAVSTLHAGEVDITMHGQTEGRRELPVEMVFRKGGNGAQSIQVQIILQMPVDVIQHPLHPDMVVSKRRCHHSSSVAAPARRRWRWRAGSES